MSSHEGVSCNSCLKRNFRGRRYKCLICYDYDLCAACYEAGATTTRHTSEHSMQCILTRADFELYYGGEALTSLEQPQAYTCPYCNRMGFTDSTLLEHVNTEHSDISFEVVCPVCASVPGGDPNPMTDDLVSHLTLEHRSGPRDLISFLDEPVSTRPYVRRIPHTSRGVTGTRSRRSDMHFRVLLSQLPGVVAQQLERLPRRQLQTTNVTGGRAQTQTTVLREPANRSSAQTANSQFLLARLPEELSIEPAIYEQRAERGIFVQQLLLSTMTQENAVLSLKIEQISPYNLFGRRNNSRSSKEGNL